MQHFLKVVALAALLFVAAACQLPDESGSGEPSSSTTTQPEPEDEPSPTEVLSEPVATPLATPSTITLTVWGPPELSREQFPALAAGLAAFDKEEAEVTIVYETKAMTGTASMLNYLETASSVAPSILPDLILFPSDMLVEVAQTGLLVPLENEVDASLLTDLYPFAEQAAFEGAQLALPLLLSVEHGIILSENSPTIPAQLEGLLEEEAPKWRFEGQVAEEGSAAPTLLAQLASLNEKNGLLVAPNVVKLTEMLTRLQQAGKQGTIVPQSFSTSDSESLFTALEREEVGLIEHSSQSFIQQRAERDDLTYSPVPSLDGELRSIVHGYLIAMTTEDPRRQGAAVALLNTLMEPTTFSQWSIEQQWLPGRRSALEFTDLDPDYRTFLDELLVNAQLVPSGAEWRNFSQLYQEQVQLLFDEPQISPGQVARRLLDSYPSSDD